MQQPEKEKHVPDHKLTRRSAVTGALAAPLLAACAGEDEPSATATESSSAAAPSSSAPTPTSSAPAGGSALASAEEIEVGGGKIFPDENVVITQPEEGVFKGFDATCTHNACQVTQVADGTINCKCHLSKFSVEDGSVQGGPAPRPLPEVAISVANGEISLA